jgi:hypothetical protein
MIMNRRAFLTGSAFLFAGTTVGIAWKRYSAPRPDLSALIAELNDLSLLSVRSTGTWSPFQIFSHLAQSIEYSMTGYPEMKSSLFRHTAGSLAFFAFGTAGTMRHPLTEPIPGAPALTDTGDTTQAHARLIKALTDFTHWTGSLQPHFAYGTLSKEEYAQAHLMHVRNHLQEIHTAV